MYRKQIVAYYLPAFTFAHRARCAAAIFFRAEADIVRPFFGAGATLFACPLVSFSFAHRAFWAAAIRALPAVEIVRLAPLPFAKVEPNAASAAEIP